MMNNRVPRQHTIAADRYGYDWNPIDSTLMIVSPIVNVCGIPVEVIEDKCGLAVPINEAVKFKSGADLFQYIDYICDLIKRNGLTSERAHDGTTD